MSIQNTFTHILSLLLPALLIWGCGNRDPKVRMPDAVPTTPQGVSAAKPDASGVPEFSGTVSYDAISFTVTSPNRPLDNTAHLTSHGLTAVNADEDIPLTGKVTGLLIGDIDSDNQPELVILTQSGNNRQGAAYIYSSNNGKSVSMVNLPELKDNPKALQGYNGFDEFAIGENAFLRRFPLFEGDKRTGKYRQFQYRLKNGEASKQLILYRTVEF